MHRLLCNRNRRIVACPQWFLWYRIPVWPPAATLNAALLLKVNDQLGTLAPNMVADLIAVKGDPIANIRLMRKVAFVMKEGVVYKNE